MARHVTVSALGPLVKEFYGPYTYAQKIQAMIEHWDAQIAAVLPEKPDLIVLPEACDRYGGDFDSPLQEWRNFYEERGNRIRDHFAQVAKDSHCYIAYSAARKAEDGFFRNSTQFIGRDGRVEGIYNKNHLVVCEGVLDGPLPMLCGKEEKVFDLDFGKVGCAICFDLNFDELRHKYMKNRPELMVFSSMYHGGFMQQAWAYDMRSWFVGAIARDECRIISPVGQVVATNTNYFPYVTATINLDYAVCHLDENWDRFRAAKEKYGREVGFFDPGHLGAALLTSESEERSVQDIVQEFGIELLDDYFERSRRSQRARIEP